MNCCDFFTKSNRENKGKSEGLLRKGIGIVSRSEIENKRVQLEGEIGDLKVVLGEREKELNRKIQLHYEEYLEKSTKLTPLWIDVYACKVYGEEGKETYVKTASVFGEIDMTDIEGFGSDFPLFSSKFAEYCKERENCYEEKRGNMVFRSLLIS